MKTPMPDSLESFADEPVTGRNCGASGDPVNELFRRENQDWLRLQGLLLAGASSDQAAPADATYFTGLRARVGNSSGPAAGALPASAQRPPIL